MNSSITYKWTNGTKPNEDEKMYKKYTSFLEINIILNIFILFM